MNQSRRSTGLAFIAGGLLVAVAVLGSLYFADSQREVLTIETPAGDVRVTEQ